MKKIVTILLLSLLLTGCKTKSTKEFNIGVIQWAEHPALKDSLEGMKQGLEDVGMIDSVYLDVKNANEDASNATMITSQFVNSDYDLIFAIATPAAQTAMNMIEATDIPLVFAAVSDAQLAGLVENPLQPNGKITGVSDLPPLRQQLELMKTLLPELKTVGVLFNTSEINGQNQIKEVKELAKDFDIEIVEKGVSTSNEIAQAALQLSTETDTLFIVNDNMIANAAGLLVDQFKKVNKPVFMAEDGQFDQGILASDSVSYYDLGKQAGHMIFDILINQENISNIPVETAKETRLLINKKMAEDLGIVIPKSLLESAEVR